MKKSIKYSKALAQRILSQIESGKNLREICRQDGYPTPRAVHLWRHKDIHTIGDKTFGEVFLVSESIRISNRVEQVLEAADEDGYTYLTKKLGREPSQLEVRSDEARRRRQIDTIKFLVAREISAQTKRVEVAHTGQIDSGMTVNVLSYNAAEEGSVIDLQPEHLKIEEEPTDV